MQRAVGLINGTPVGMLPDRNFADSRRVAAAGMSGWPMRFIRRYGRRCCLAAKAKG